MIVYHGGTQHVPSTQIVQTGFGRDFGPGFYVTGILAQAEKWARRQARVRRAGAAVVNVYAFDEQAAESALRVLRFTEYSMAWLDVVLAGLPGDTEYRHGFDVVFGKIANDDVGETVQAVLDGLMPKSHALQRLAFMEANEQYGFCTEASLSFLRFKEARSL
jgi:hypothetical protein